MAGGPSESPESFKCGRGGRRVRVMRCECLTHSGWLRRQRKRPGAMKRILPLATGKGKEPDCLLEPSERSSALLIA